MGQKVAVFYLSNFVGPAVSEELQRFPAFEEAYSSSQRFDFFTRIKREHVELIILEISHQTSKERLDLIQKLKSHNSRIDVIVIAPASSEGGNLALRAMDFGATDFVALPLLGDEFARAKIIKRRLNNVLNGYLRKRQYAIDNEILRVDPKLLKEIAEEVLEVTTRPRKAISFTPELIAIGISTGGPNALSRLMSALDSVSVPILIVQHMPPFFTASLAQNLRAKIQLDVHEAKNEDILERRHVYIAPGGKQMMVTKNALGRAVIKITDDPPLHNCRPSVDYLFSSLAKNLPAKVLALIMTGMGNDGAKGCLEIRESGGVVFAQDEASCVVFGMPREAIKLGGVDKVLSLDELAPEVCLTLANPTLAISRLSLK